MTIHTQSRSRLIRKLSKGLVLSTPLVLAAFSMSPIAHAQSSNCPAGSKLSSDGFCMVTSTYEARPVATGEAEAGSAHKAAGEAEAGSAHKAVGEAEATGEAESAGSAYKAQPEATGEAEAQPTSTYSSSYKAQPEATGEAEAGSSYKASGEAEAEPEAKGEAEASNGQISSGSWTKKSFKAKGAWSPGSLLIAPLQSNKGAQTYVIPAGTDLSNYKSVIIHCEAYTKLWSAADL